MFDIVMYRGVALIITVIWVILRIVMGEVVCVIEATYIIGRNKHNMLALLWA